MQRYSFRSGPMTIDGQFTIARLPAAGKFPLCCAWVVDPTTNAPWGLYWSNGLTWQPLSGPPGPAGPIGATGPAGAPGTVKQGIRAVTNASGLYTWTYPTPYAVGVVPVIELSAEGSASLIVNPQLEGTPTNTSCTVRVTRTAAVTILGISVLGISASAATPIHITAQAPT